MSKRLYGGESTVFATRFIPVVYTERPRNKPQELRVLLMENPDRSVTEDFIDSENKLSAPRCVDVFWQTKRHFTQFACIEVKFFQPR